MDRRACLEAKGSPKAKDWPARASPGLLMDMGLTEGSLIEKYSSFYLLFLLQPFKDVESDLNTEIHAGHGAARLQPQHPGG